MISGTSPAASEETDYCWDIWIAAEGDSVFQSQHINMLLKEQLQSLCKEGNNIKTSIGDVEKAMSSMEAELSRIKQAETMKTLLEAEIQTAKKTLEEEQESASQKELYLRKLEKDNEDLHLRLLMLSEEKKLQECKLASGVEDEIFRKMKHQARELEESIKEYEAVIQVLQNKEKSLQDQLSAAEEKARTLPRTPSNILSINPKSLMFEIVKAELEDKIRGKEKNQMKHIFGGRLSPKWILVLLWQLTGVLLAILLAATLVTLFVLYTCFSDHTVTEAYHQPPWQFLDYYLWPYMKLHSSGMLPK
ncbi:intracellular protein transport protein USO1-like isoform X3 [Mauremys mutica]|uniref:intracellular protein transport protein USO1-like isoform X3 n=1 Tax=Mauremys mutica TaxID=74926 RepID=UPI001D162C0D|nr:intracellular protein transport protein USO1-like isoform X3 [Mauremys mutica]